MPSPNGSTAPQLHSSISAAPTPRKLSLFFRSNSYHFGHSRKIFSLIFRTATALHVKAFQPPILVMQLTRISLGLLAPRRLAARAVLRHFGVNLYVSLQNFPCETRCASPVRNSMIQQTGAGIHLVMCFLMVIMKGHCSNQCIPN